MTDLPGELAGYRVLSTLGTGAASTIYEVRDPEDGQRYALKLLHKHQTSDQCFLDQVVNEHAICGQFNHPSLRRSHRLIRRRSLSLRTTEIMLLMELVEGQTLAVIRPPAMADMVRVFQAVAQGLAHMHAAGVIHADLKPINIMLTPAGAVKIIDFGQSCPVGTFKQRIQGTLDYIAPEQLERSMITPATDVFNLGATMYWCVTARHVPKLSKKKVAGGQHRQLVRSEAMNPRDINPEVPGALATLILECIQREAKRRPGNMSHVLARLDMALNQLGRERSPAVTGEP